MKPPCWIAIFFLLASSAGAAEKPNVLFLAVDDLRPELGSFGARHMATPQLDRLARRGVRFERAFCMVPTCGASRASLMTGIRPSPRRFTSYLTRADQDAPGVTTLNTHFQEHGYHTVSLGKIFHHAADNEEGWSEKPWRPDASTYATKAANKARVKDRRGRSRGPSWEDGGDVKDDFYGDGKVANMAIRKLRELAKTDQPFFLAAGFYKPHLPFVAPGRYFRRYPADSISMPTNYFPPKKAPRGAVHSSGELRAYSDIPKKGVLPEPKALELIRGYYAATSYTDAQIGRILDVFDELGLAENTIVVLWGDHGWNLGEHTMWCKHSCFETSMRAPLIVSAPMVEGVNTDAATQSLAEFIDIYPTLCELAGLPKPGHLEGSSLLPILRDSKARVKDAAIGRFGKGDTIRTERYRYSVYRDSRGKQTGHMLYDHEKDPDENLNVADDPEYAEVVADLATRLADGMGK